MHEKTKALKVAANPGDIGGIAESAHVPSPTPCAENAAKAAILEHSSIHGGESTAPVLTNIEAKSAGDGMLALKLFYEALSLAEQDEALLFHKRGLESRTSAMLGFRSNPKSNRNLLIALEKRLGFEEMRKAGLWLDHDSHRKQECRPNSQYYGYGIVAKKKAAEALEEAEEDIGQWIWGWQYPILIPYLGEDGALQGLRPHKGMGRRGTLVGTPRLYVPRCIATPNSEIQNLRTKMLALPRMESRREITQSIPSVEEKFDTVILTEGEYKAAVLWQSVGAGRTDSEEPWGSASLPGISFGKNYAIRAELEDWMLRVKCQRVIVAYDDEEKGDPKLASYKPDWRKRHDSQIWARYLATDLAQKLHLRGEICMLPKRWRNENGKADWDGACAMLREQRSGRQDEQEEEMGIGGTKIQ